MGLGWVGWLVGSGRVGPARVAWGWFGWVGVGLGLAHSQLELPPRLPVNAQTRESPAPACQATPQTCNLQSPKPPTRTLPAPATPPRPRNPSPPLQPLPAPRQDMTTADDAHSLFWWGINVAMPEASAPGDLELRGRGLNATWPRDRHTRVGCRLPAGAGPIRVWLLGPRPGRSPLLCTRARALRPGLLGLVPLAGLGPAGGALFAGHAARRAGRRRRPAQAHVRPKAINPRKQPKPKPPR